MTTFVGFDQLHAQVTPTQRKILSSIWQHFYAKKQWVLTRVTHHQFGKDVVLEAINPLGGTIVYEAHNVGDQRYQLTLLGILLTDQGVEILKCFERYLGYIRKKYMSDPETDLVTSKEILSQGSLTEEQVYLLGKVLSISPFWGGSFGGSNGEWNTRFPEDVDEFPSIDDFENHIKRKLMTRYNPSVPISERERALRADFSDGEAQQGKELDQKFEIVLSPKQAKLDFDQWVRGLEESKNEIAVLFVDIDNFKSLNTTFTETKVDSTILPDFMRLLKSLSKNRGDVYRQGGDEFLVILPNHVTKESLAFGERLRSAVAGHTFPINEVDQKLTVSVGIAHWPKNGQSYEEVLQKANEAKKEAKKTKNCVKFIDFRESEASPVLPSSPACTFTITLTPKEPQPISRHKLLDQLIASSYSRPLNDFGRRRRWPLYKDRSNLDLDKEDGWISARITDSQYGLEEDFQISSEGQIQFVHIESYLKDPMYVSLDRVINGLLSFWPCIERFSRTRPGTYRATICLKGILGALLSVDMGLVFAKDWIAKKDCYGTDLSLVLPVLSTVERDNFLLQVIHAICSPFAPRGVSLSDFREEYIKNKAEKFLTGVHDVSNEDE